jgi:hypothetical protein
LYILNTYVFPHLSFQGLDAENIVVHWVKFVVCKIDNKANAKTRKKRTVMQCLLANMVTKKNYWLQSLLPRILLGDQQLVDKSLADLNKKLTYQQLLRATDKVSFTVNDIQLLSEGKMAFMLPNSLQIGNGNYNDNSYVPSTAFMRVILETDESTDKVVPFWQGGISIFQKIILDVKENVAIMQREIGRMRDLWRTFLTNYEGDSNEDIDYLQSHFLLLTSDGDEYTFHLEKLIFEWNDDFLTISTYLQNSTDEPLFSEKIALFQLGVMDVITHLVSKQKNNTNVSLVSTLITMQI